MKIKAVLFDYGNVIGKNPDEELFVYLSRELNKPINEVQLVVKEELKPLFVSKGDDKTFWKKVINRLSSEKDPSKFFNLFNIFYKERLLPNNKILDIAKEIRKKNIKTGVLSNMESTIINICKSNKYFDGFDPLILSSEVGAIKPDKEIYIKALSKLKINNEDASSVVFIDDNTENLDSASSMGIITVHFNLRNENPEILKEKLKSAGVPFN